MNVPRSTRASDRKTIVVMTLPVQLRWTAISGVAPLVRSPMVSVRFVGLGPRRRGPSLRKGPFRILTGIVSPMRSPFWVMVTPPLLSRSGCRPPAHERSGHVERPGRVAALGVTPNYSKRHSTANAGASCGRSEDLHRTRSGEGRRGTAAGVAVNRDVRPPQRATSARGPWSKPWWSSCPAQAGSDHVKVAIQLEDGPRVVGTGFDWPSCRRCS